MKNKFKFALIGCLLLAASGFHAAKAITADELFLLVQVYALQVGQALGQVWQGLLAVEEKANDNASRIENLETGDLEARLEALESAALEERLEALESADLQARISDLEARIQVLESEPGATVVPGAPSIFDDINAGFTIGTLWVDSTTGDAYILVDNVPGQADWRLVTATTTYNIGDSGPAGGIVIAVGVGGVRGLEAAPVDLVVSEWGCEGVELPGADGEAVGTGAQNTADIQTGCPVQPIAASLADSYSLNGFDDWFLPARDELDELYQNRDLVPGLSAATYWSSTELNASSAFTQNFATGSAGTSFKSNVFAARAVREF